MIYTRVHLVLAKCTICKSRIMLYMLREPADRSCSSHPSPRLRLRWHQQLHLGLSW